MNPVPVLIVALVILVGLVFVVTAWSSPPPSPPAFPSPPGSWLLGPGCEFVTNATQHLAQDMKTCETRNGNATGRVVFLQGDLLLTKLNRLDPTMKSALFTWWVSPVPFPNPLANYSSVPKNATQIGSMVVETWYSSATQYANLSTSFTIRPGSYLAVVIDASPNVHAESQVSAVVEPS